VLAGAARAHTPSCWFKSSEARFRKDGDETMMLIFALGFCLGGTAFCLLGMVLHD
jgi:hypothetical protein